jgi:hypothetical protein
MIFEKLTYRRTVVLRTGASECLEATVWAGADEYGVDSIWNQLQSWVRDRMPDEEPAMAPERVLSSFSSGELQDEIDHRCGLELRGKAYVRPGPEEKPVPGIDPGDNIPF